jgi:hypothetical protein
MLANFKAMMEITDDFIYFKNRNRWTEGLGRQPQVPDHRRQQGKYLHFRHCPRYHGPGACRGGGQSPPMACWPMSIQLSEAFLA